MRTSTGREIEIHMHERKKKHRSLWCSTKQQHAAKALCMRRISSGTALVLGGCCSCGSLRCTSPMAQASPRLRLSQRCYPTHTFVHAAWDAGDLGRSFPGTVPRARSHGHGSLQVEAAREGHCLSERRETGSPKTQPQALVFVSHRAPCVQPLATARRSFSAACLPSATRGFKAFWQEDFAKFAHTHDAMREVLRRPVAFERAGANGGAESMAVARPRFRPARPPAAAGLWRGARRPLAHAQNNDFMKGPNE